MSWNNDGDISVMHVFVCFVLPQTAMQSLQQRYRLPPTILPADVGEVCANMGCAVRAASICDAGAGHMVFHALQVRLLHLLVCS